MCIELASQRNLVMMKQTTEGPHHWGWVVTRPRWEKGCAPVYERTLVASGSCFFKDQSNLLEHANIYSALLPHGRKHHAQFQTSGLRPKKAQLSSQIRSDVRGEGRSRQGVTSFVVASMSLSTALVRAHCHYILNFHYYYYYCYDIILLPIQGLTM